MRTGKNLVMIGFAAIVLIISLIVHFLHRVVEWVEVYTLLEQSRGAASSSAHIAALVVLFGIALITLLAAIVLYRRNKEHPYIPYLITISTSFGSMSIIAGGEGMVDYHFSVFMVIAAANRQQSLAEEFTQITADLRAVTENLNRQIKDVHV